MSILADLGQKLIDAHVCTGFWNGTTGDLGLDFRPPSPEVFYALFSSVQAGAEDVMGTANMPAYTMPRVQFSARGLPSDYLGPRGKCIDAQTALTAIVNTTISSTPYYRVQALDEPIFMGRDANDRVLFAVNFQVTKTPS
jgi:hypothetical protein